MILNNVVRNIKKGHDAVGQEKINRMISLMKQHFEDAEVTGYEGLLSSTTNNPEGNRK